jgi:hypothetical protein
MTNEHKELVTTDFAESVADTIANDEVSVDGVDVSQRPEYFYENANQVFGIRSEVIELDGNLYVPIYEMEDDVFENIKEDFEPTTEIEVEGVTYKLSDQLFKDKDEVLVLLVQEGEQVESTDEDESEEDYQVVEIDGEEYLVVENEEDADFAAFVAVSDEDELVLVEEDSEGAEVLYLVKVSDLENDSDEDSDDE